MLAVLSRPLIAKEDETVYARLTEERSQLTYLDIYFRIPKNNLRNAVKEFGQRYFAHDKYPQLI